MNFEYKGYYVKPHAQYPSSFVIVTQGQGGKIPKVMEGLFTSRGIAMEVIDSYTAPKASESDNDKKIGKRGV